MQLTKLEGDSWTKHTARVGLPILVEYARNRREITYQEWDGEIVRRGLGKHVMVVAYKDPAGAIGDACEEYAAETKIAVPMINLMVVNKITRVPGKGANYYIEQFCKKFQIDNVGQKHLSKQGRRAIIERAIEEIFDFPGWEDMLQAYGLEETKRKHRSMSPKGKLPQPNPDKWHTGPESKAHKELKRRIEADPTLLGLPANAKGQQEIRLWSGDRVDVYFEKSAVAVEVKPGTAGFDELHRGIFQCIKYKAVLRAQQIYDRLLPTAKCFLAVGGRLPKDLREVAELFEVPFFDNLGE